MKCIHCDTEMITANMDTGMTVGSYFYLWNDVGVKSIFLTPYDIRIAP